jgi:hypothetical protein
MADIDTYIMSGSKPTIKKDPNATLDYPFDWSKWLANVSDTISTVTFLITDTSATPITKTAQSFTAVTATAWIAGGTAGTAASLTCRITTAGGRTEDRTIVLKIVER